MFLDWKNQHCENDYTTKSNPQIQCNPYETAKASFTELEQKISQPVWKQKAPNSQSNLVKEKQSWRNQAPCLQTIL